MEQPLCLHNYLFTPGFDYHHTLCFSYKSGEEWRYNSVKFLSFSQLSGKTCQTKAPFACFVLYLGYFLILL